MGASGSVIDSLWIALRVKVEGDGLREVKSQVNQAKESLISAGAALKAFVAGFAIKQIADIGSTFEQNQIQIAGFLSALGNSKNFNQGLQDAQGVIQQITKDAAILPGEAQEYIDVFKAGLPFVQGAMPGGSLSDITAFTNKLTAIGKTFGLDSGLIAREFDHMLSPGKGMASLRLPLFRQLMSFMPKMANGARVTAEAFNAMSAPQRLQLLQNTFEKLQPMLDASANSFDAMWGAAVSAVKQMTRMATVPLFKGMKQSLDAINSAFYDSSGNLTAFGHGVVDAVSTGTKYLTQFLAMAGHIVMWFAKSKAGAVALKVALGLLGTALAGLAIEKTVSSFGKLFGVMGNIKSLLTGGLLALFALIAEDLYQFETGGESVTGMLVDKFAPALTLVKLALIAVGTALLAINTNPFIAAIYGGVMLGKVLADIIYKLGVLGALEPKELRDFKAPEKFDRSGASSATEDTDTSFLNKPDSAEKMKSGARVHAWHGQMHFSKQWTPASNPPAPQIFEGPRLPGDTNTNTYHNTFNITAPDAPAAADAVSRRLVRDSQTKTKL